MPDENAPFNATRVDSKIELVECASINGNVLRKARDVVVDQKDCRQEYWVVAYGDVLKMVPEMMMTGQNRITTVGGRFGPGEQILACILFTLLNCNKSYHISTLSISIVGLLKAFVVLHNVVDKKYVSQITIKLYPNKEQLFWKLSTRVHSLSRQTLFDGQHRRRGIACYGIE